MNFETINAQLEAARVVAEIPRHGGLLLRVVKNGNWRLLLMNGQAVPETLKKKLMTLQPHVMVLLRELSYEA